VRTSIRETLFFTGALLVWAALVAFQVGASFGFGTAGLLGLVLAASLLGFCVAVVIGIISQRWRVTLYFGVALFVVFSSSWTARFISERQRQDSIAAAQPIIAAAERFYTASGAYPQSLDDLVPAYLPAEPRTKMGFRGTPFVLSSRPDRFYVTFELPSWMLCTYDSQSKQWDISD
jgi:hypothetical protein